MTDLDESLRRLRRAVEDASRAKPAVARPPPSAVRPAPEAEPIPAGWARPTIAPISDATVEPDTSNFNSAEYSMPQTSMISRFMLSVSTLFCGARHD